MSVYLAIGGELGGQFASNSGMGDFIRWVDSLPADEFPLLSHFADHGWANELELLEGELERALGRGVQGSVRKTAIVLAKALADRNPRAGTVILSDGLTSEDDEDGEWWIDGKPV